MCLKLAQMFVEEAARFHKDGDLDLSVQSLDNAICCRELPSAYVNDVTVIRRMILDKMVARRV